MQFSIKERNIIQLINQISNIKSQRKTTILKNKFLEKSMQQCQIIDKNQQRAPANIKVNQKQLLQHRIYFPYNYFLLQAFLIFKFLIQNFPFLLTGTRSVHSLIRTGTNCSIQTGVDRINYCYVLSLKIWSIPVWVQSSSSLDGVKKKLKKNILYYM